VTAPRVVMGYDPGILKSGFGVVARHAQRYDLVDGATIETDPNWETTARLHYLWGVLAGAVIEHKPVVLAIENQLNVMVAARQAMIARIKAMLRGRRGGDDYLGFNASNDAVYGAQVVAMGVAWAYGVQLHLLEPKAIKIGVGAQGGGNAEKKHVKEAVLRIFPDAGRISSHAADGIATAVTGERETFMESRRFG
jgi:Holliday junction resolvasome RuvABC endonuclease subunit